MATNDNESLEDAVFNDRGRKMVLRAAMVAVGAGWTAAFAEGIVPMWTGPVGVPLLITAINGLIKPANDNNETPSR